MKSGGCRDLANALTEKLGYKVWRTKAFNVPFDGRTLWVNWGSTSEIPINRAEILNHPEAVYTATSKVRTFQALQGKVAIPEWNTNHPEAAGWHTGMARSDGEHGGAGITIVNNGEPWPVADFYVQYIPPIYECRVHVMNGTIIDYTEKGRKDGDKAVGAALMIRSHSNGWIFLRQGRECSGDVADAAKAAVAALGLNFGAVDIVKSRLDGQPYVLEVNTAPGLEGTTLERYVEAFTSLGSENA